MARQRVRLDIEYDGTHFFGWQRQRRLPTVQGELERAFEIVVRRAVRVVGAGRTDAGVHAKGQVGHADLIDAGPFGRLMLALNALTPPGIAVQRVRPVPATFHAQRSATARTYRYRLSLRPIAYERAYVWHVHAPLSFSLLKRCAEALPGAHNFLSFCVAGSASRGTVCRVERAVWRRREGEYQFSIVANRFVHGMIRSLVGTMVEVAAGKRSVASFQRLLDTPERKRVGPTAPPHGLCLVKVDY